MLTDEIRGLMDGDVRNLGRLVAFLRDAMPSDVIPACASLVICLMHSRSGSNKRSLASPALKPSGHPSICLTEGGKP